MCDKPGCMYPQLEEGQPMPYCNCAVNGNARSCPFHVEADFPHPPSDRPMPMTETGRKLFTDVAPMDMWESNGVTPDDICEVERQARASLVAGLLRLIYANQIEELL